MLTKLILSLFAFLMPIHAYCQNNVYMLPHEGGYTILVLNSDSTFEIELSRDMGHVNETILLSSGTYSNKSGYLKLYDSLWTLEYKISTNNIGANFIESDVSYFQNQPFKYYSTNSDIQRSLNEKIKNEIINSKKSISKQKRNLSGSKISGDYTLRAQSVFYMIVFKPNNTLVYTADRQRIIEGKYTVRGKYICIETQTNKYYLEIKDNNIIEVVYFPFLFPKWRFVKK